MIWCDMFMPRRTSRVLQSRFVAGSVCHRLKLPASASDPLCPGPDILLRGVDEDDPAILLGIGGGVGGLMAASGGRLAVKGAGNGVRDDLSVASSIKETTHSKGLLYQEQQLQKSQANLSQQSAHDHAVFLKETTVNDGGNERESLSAELSSRVLKTAPVATSSAAGSSKVASWLQASEAAFAEERALFMRDSADASNEPLASADISYGNSANAEAVIVQPLSRINGNSSSSSSKPMANMGACRVDFERIEMTGGGSLAQPMILAALRASGTGSMKQVRFTNPVYSIFGLS